MTRESDELRVARAVRGCDRCGAKGGWWDFPSDERGSFAPCPICGRRYCDHPLSDRGDGVWVPCPDCGPEEEA